MQSILLRIDLLLYFKFVQESRRVISRTVIHGTLQAQAYDCPGVG